ncbi:WD40 repeat-like protein [Aureobasidium sp. EXF-12298]|nr:WD40 repeat-like protein [Aureobasidium sp. EXF-12298]
MQASATLLHNLKAHTDEVARLAFSPDGKTLAAHDDSTITLWDVETGSLLSKTEDLDDMFFEMAFSPNGKWIAAASDEGIARIWNSRTGDLKRMVLATGSEVLRVWELETGELLHTLLAPGDHTLSFSTVYAGNDFPAEISEVVFACDGKMLISECPAKSTICIWSTESWKLEHIITGYAACFSPNGRHVSVLKGEDRVMQIYETSTWQLHSTLEDEEQQVFPSTFSPDSRTIATCSGHKINLWDVNSGKAVRAFEDPARKATALAFTRDGRILLSGTRKCGMRVWDIESGDNLLALEPEGGARDPWNGWIRGDPPAFEVLFGDGGAKVAVAFPDGSVKIWDVRWEVT